MHDGHDHSHGHTNDISNEADKTKLLLRFTLEHNIQHVSEVKLLADKLEKESRDKAAELIRESIPHYEAGNAKLDEALRILE